MVTEIRTIREASGHKDIETRLDIEPRLHELLRRIGIHLDELPIAEAELHARLHNIGPIGSKISADEVAELRAGLSAKGLLGAMR